VPRLWLKLALGGGAAAVAYIMVGAVLVNLLNLALLRHGPGAAMTVGPVAVSPGAAARLAAVFPLQAHRFERVATLLGMREGDLGTLRQVAWALLQAGEAPRAVALWRQSSGAVFLVMRGRGALARDDSPGAHELARLALEVDPRSRPAHLLMGDVQLAEGAYPEAAASLQRALELGPFESAIACRAGYAAFRAGSANQAVSLLREGVAYNPADAECQEFLGQSLLATGDAPAALAVLTRAVALRPESVWARYIYGLAFQEVGDCAVARAQWAEALRLDSGFAPATSALQEGQCESP
jgi:tetratricopeptide (TPR) repeat protein